MKKIDRDLLYKFENCNSRFEMENLIENIDDDDLNFILVDKYRQILKFNPNEKINSIRNIIIYRYRKYCNEYVEKETEECEENV